MCKFFIICSFSTSQWTRLRRRPCGARNSSRLKRCRPLRRLHRPAAYHSSLSSPSQQCFWIQGANHSNSTFLKYPIHFHSAILNAVLLLLIQDRKFLCGAMPKHNNIYIFAGVSNTDLGVSIFVSIGSLNICRM